MAEQPVTRYATGSGAHIAYQVLGHGPALVIARRVYISRETVQTHLKHIFGKLGVDSRTALAALAAPA